MYLFHIHSHVSVHDDGDDDSCNADVHAPHSNENDAHVHARDDAHVHDDGRRGDDGDVSFRLGLRVLLLR